jgi:hypothetical protein
MSVQCVMSVMNDLQASKRLIILVVVISTVIRKKYTRRNISSIGMVKSCRRYCW